MKPALPGTDLLPWYRQFWPWFLIALPGTVVVAAIGTLVIGSVIIYGFNEATKV